MSSDAASGTPQLTPLQRAFLALEDAEARLAVAEGRVREPVAIIGMGCRLPGADNPAALWRMLRDGVDAVGPVPGGRFDLDAIFDPDPDATGTTLAREAGFLSDVDRFDPTFFGIARREAQGMDPQQRLLLEVSWEALESAGRAPDRLKRSLTGVYVGVSSNDYANLQLKNADVSFMDAHYASGIAHSVAAGRVSYVLGLQGPSVAIDTACSSSLVAVHLACQALRAGDCNLALAGGVNLMLSPDLFVAFTQSRMLAPDGRCKAFDARADGFGRGEGCAMVVLKRLSDAQADGDRILAVIRGSAINQDGPSSGLTAPNGPQQEAVIRDALSRAGLVAGDVGYIEAHGTGTQLGDPLEMQALGTVFAGREKGRPVFVGSLKTNIGHVEAAAGVAGLLKVVLALQHREIPPHLHFETPSPHIDWDSLPVRVPVEPTTWEPIGGRRIGGLSSFGFSGTNAHVVVEEAPERTPLPKRPSEPQRAFLFVLSARDRASLSRVARSYADAFAPLGDAALATVCYSAAVAKAEHAERAVITVRSMGELRERLTALAEEREADGVRTNRVVRRDPARIAFLFSGQGAQFAGMARSLYDSEPVFRAAFDRCAAVADVSLARPLREVVFGANAAQSPIDETGFSQPALFAVEYALAELWRSLGVVPDVVMGHSVGEIVAACIAGVMTIEDGVRLIVARARLMQSLPPGGAMAAIHAPELIVAKAIAPYAATVSIAALNAPTQTVISGVAANVDAICEQLAARGIRGTRLKVSHAFHSPLVEPMLAEFEGAVRATRLAPPRLRLISNVTGGVAEASQVTDPAYWKRHVREPVRFAAGVETLATLSPDVCIEVGPHATLLPLLDGVMNADTTTVLATLRKGRADREQFFDSLGALFLAGVPVDWHAAWRADGPELVDLPAYPYQRERLWFASQPVSHASARGMQRGVHGLLGARVRSPIADYTQYDALLDAATIPFARDHVVGGRIILPATAFIEMALAAAQDAFGAPRAIADMIIAEPLVFGEDGARAVQVVVHHGSEMASFAVHSWDDGRSGWVKHAEGAYDTVSRADALESADAIRARCTAVVDKNAHYANLDSRGLAFGPSLQGVDRVHRRDGEALGEITLPAAAGGGAYVAHPALLDACIQVLTEAVPLTVPPGTRYLPVAIGRVEVARALPSRLLSHVVLHDAGAQGTMKADITVLDDNGVVARIRGIALRAVRERAAVDDALYEIAWKPEPDTSWMPAAAAISSDVGRAFESLMLEHDLDDYNAAFLALESITASWIVRALVRLGWKPAMGDAFTTAKLRAELGVVPRYERLLARLLTILNEEGVVTARNDEWVVTALPSARDGSEEMTALEARHPSSHARFALTARTGPVLDGVLRGTEDPLQLLFPQGSTDLAVPLYRDAPEAKVFNSLVRGAVRSIVERLPSDRALRILEVGGGTGGTTSWLLPILPADRTQYTFTDIGALLVAQARERFGAYPFAEFRTFDVEQPADAQGFGNAAYDIIIASNVVHATADLRRTLESLKGLLVPGGMLLMSEVAGYERWIDITFGLTEGWWRFTDTDLRPAYPLLARPEWTSLLRSIGFDAYPVGREDARTRGMLFAARAPMAAAALETDGRWLVLGDDSGVGTALTQRLQAAGQSAALVNRTDPAGETVTPDELRRMLALHTNVHGIVYLWSLDVSLGAGESVVARQRAALEPLLAIVQVLGGQSFDAGTTPRVFVATRGAHAIEPGRAVNVAQAPVWGMGKVIDLEHAELHTTRIDLDPDGSADAMSAELFVALTAPNSEPEVALRGGRRFVPRLVRSVDRRAEGEANTRLVHSASGVLDDVVLQAAPRHSPARGEVEILVHAAGLNFRDVMNAVAMRDDPEPLGGECAGRVVSVGEGVEGVKVGDDVIAVAEACFARYAIADASLMAPLPRNMSHGDGATIPFAFMTAHHALIDRAKLRAGETVLIHAAAGGVGMAAIQIARRVGARIIATAGNDHKRAVVRAMGVEHVFNSRDTTFREGIASVTQGNGVDVVLNSLAGDIIGASVDAMSPNGRFLEIGKREIWTSEQFTAARPTGVFHVIDLAALRLEDPAAFLALFRTVANHAARGDYHALPAHGFALQDGAAAFRFMAQARHTGKIVLMPRSPGFGDIDRRGAYLVTGGLTGLGLLSAGLLADAGARMLFLIGRRAPTPDAENAIDRMRHAGVTVQCLQADISRVADVDRIFLAIDAAHAPLRGVIHSAGALEDASLMQQRWDRFAVPLGPKVEGAWALHERTRHRALDFFLMYSSVASVLGSAGQANHAAANAFLDALAAYRTALGLPAVSVSWGAWSGIGAAAERNVDAQVGERGIAAISPDEGARIIARVVAGGVPHVVAVKVDWERFGQSNAGQMRSPLLEGMRRYTGAKPVRGTSSSAGRPVPRARATAFVEELTQASPVRRAELLLEFVAEQVARSVGAPDADAIDPTQPLSELGLDSLMAVELRNQLGAGLGLARSLPATLVFDHPTLQELADYLSREIVPAALPVAQRPPREQPATVKELSDAEVDELFAQRLKSR